MTGLIKRIPLFAASCLLYLFSSLAVAAPLVEIDTDTVQMDLPPYVDILEDADGSLTIGDVMSERYTFQFAPASMTELFFGYTTSVYWMRFTIENQRDADMRFILEAAPIDVDYLDIYEIDPLTGQLLRHKRSGSATPYSDREYSYPQYLFELDIESHAAYTYYLRAESDKTVNLQLFLSTPREYLQRAGERDRWQGIVLGALGIACVLHFALFLLFRFKGFLWYSLFLGSILTIQLSWNGYLLQFFANSETLLDRQLLSPIYLSITFSSLFVQSLLSLRKRVPWQQHVSTALAASALVGAVVTWFLPAMPNSLVASCLAMLNILFIFGATLHANMEGHMMARHFLLARTLTTGVILVAIFNVHGYLPQGSFTSWGIALSIIVEAVVLAMSMVNNGLQDLRRDFAMANAIVHEKQQRSLVNLADICHELRTPISGVLGMADLLMGSNVTDQQRNQVKTIQKSGQALLDVTNKLSDLSMIESGSMELNPAPFELTSLIESCIENCRSRAEFNSIELIYHIDNAITGFFKGDQEKLQQSIINLLQFALRHVEQGEVVLKVAPGEDRKPVFTIRSGHNTLLDRSTLLPENRSLGSSDHLNLTIAEQFIRLMGGLLSVQSFVDGGVSISFSVLLEPQHGASLSQPDDNVILHGRRLLIVDDNTTCCTIIEQQAAQWGMTVQSAHGGKEALAILRARTTVDELFDIALIDYDMPGMNGLELAAHIREDQNINSDKLLLIMLTGVSKAPSTIMAESAAIQRVLYKPLSGKSLKQALQVALAQHLKGN